MARQGDLNGALGRYTLRLRLPDLDDAPDPEQAPPGWVPGERAVTITRCRAPLTDGDRLVLAARFEAYLTWRHAGDPAPASARATAERIGWQAHTVAKRCENIRDRYVRLGVPGLRGPRALEELALLLISTGELSARDCGACPRLPHPADFRRPRHGEVSPCLPEAPDAPGIPAITPGA